MTRLDVTGQNQFVWDSIIKKKGTGSRRQVKMGMCMCMHVCMCVSVYECMIYTSTNQGQKPSHIDKKKREISWDDHQEH